MYMVGESQARTAVIPKPCSWARSKANPTARADCGEPSVPTTIRPADGPGVSSAAARTTTTVQCACMATCNEVEPSSRLVKTPRPREPSTTRSACADCLSSTTRWGPGLEHGSDLD